MKLPKKIKIGAIDYKVVIRKKQTEDDNIGYHDAHKSVIMISTTSFGDVRDNSSVLETLLHETLHAVDFVWNKGGLSEATITKLSCDLFDLIYHNDLMLNVLEFPKKILCRGLVYDIVYPCDITDIDTATYFSITNHRTCKIFIRDIEDDVFYYVKSKFLNCLLNIMIIRSDTYSDEDRDSILNSVLVEGIYHALLENKLDVFIRRWKGVL